VVERRAMSRHPFGRGPSLCCESYAVGSVKVPAWAGEELGR
jgi:hypothetical protein